MRIISKISFIILALALAAGLYQFMKPANFRADDVTSSVAFRSDWEVNRQTDETAILKTIVSQPWSYLGEGGQSFAFGSADGRYVLKLFKFNRFRPSAFFNSLPALPFISAYRQRHIDRRQRKLETAFTGYKLAYDLQRKESGLLLVQLNALPESLMVALKDRHGREHLVDLQHVPFVLQLKGEMLSTTLQQQLADGDIAAARNLLDELFALYRSEYAQGLRDLDRGLMHNIGSLNGTQLFHLDVGKMSRDEQMQRPDMQQQELYKIALKIHHWLQRHAPVYAAPLYQHMQSLIDQPEVSHAA